MITAVTAILTSVITAIVGPCVVQHYSNRRSEASKPASDLRPADAKLEAQPVIVSPRDSARVGLTAVIRGRTPYPGESHYLVVTPVTTNVPYVQPRPMNAAGDMVEGTARFGEPEIGAGENFLVQIEVVMRQPTTTVPAIILSDAITVRRVAPNPIWAMPVRWTSAGGALRVIALIAAAFGVGFLALLAMGRRMIRILNPANGALVPHFIYVDGRVFRTHARVLVVVHPVNSAEYWPQAAVPVEFSGRWRVPVYVGREGEEDVGSSFEIRAILNPSGRIDRSDVLSHWPAGQAMSDVIVVRRR